MKTSTGGVLQGGLLGFASIAFGAIFACALPFAALATAAARTLGARVAYGTVATVWLVSQILGFTIHHYPRDASTFAWGAIIGLAALAATLAARRAPTFALAFVAAFAAYEAVIVAYGALRHETMGMSLSAIGGLALVNVASLAILGALAYASGRLTGAGDGVSAKS